MASDLIFFVETILSD